MQIGPLSLGETPRIAVPLRDTAPPGTEQQLLDAGADIVELRLDQFSRYDRDHVAEQVRRWRRLPVLATIRSRDEGGDWSGSEAERLALYEAVMPHVAAVDVELGSDGIRGAVRDAAQAAGVTCILSHHDFQRTPADAALEAILARGKAAGADIVKIAAHCESRDDLRRLATFLLRHPDSPLIIIGMGPASAMTRVFFPVLGSLVTFAAWDAPSAPGQLGLAETHALISRFYQ